ncbi:MAG: selenobiotic family peptide radical SAM maturase [Nitrospirae bacterium]|nr:selenobiotic family peptide radical SAM maturase [Nitrospirota bacterium]
MRHEPERQTLESHKKNLKDIYPACCAFITPEMHERICKGSSRMPDPNEFIDWLSQPGGQGLPAFMPELARLEFASHTSSKARMPQGVGSVMLNPSVNLIRLSWKNLCFLLGRSGKAPGPEPGEELILVWKDPKTDEKKARPATDDDLLALKITVEELDIDALSKKFRMRADVIHRVVNRGLANGILISPSPLIRREVSAASLNAGIDTRYLSADVFTIQWHLTQACDLHCKHCYDRSDRKRPDLGQAIKILDDLTTFTKERRVSGAISFTGGNPFLHPDFPEIYRAASERGFSIAILGNPVSKEKLEAVIDIQPPSFFQVSLEGLPAYNDYIRGEGHFQRTTRFLAFLRELGVYSMVMLTLTNDNMEQVIPLAGMLRGKADSFFFNRLSRVGEGANLRLPGPEAYRAFLEKFIEASQDNPVMGLKDNLINILNYRKGMELFGGCAGHGCGAAFNFVSILPDGEVHACRKFPSLIGNIFSAGLSEIYDSGPAKRYRSGCSACNSCAIKPVCGGCLAVSYSHGLNVFEEKDPFCFMTD